MFIKKNKLNNKCVFLKKEINLWMKVLEEQIYEKAQISQKRMLLHYFYCLLLFLNLGTLIAFTILLIFNKVSFIVPLALFVTYVFILFWTIIDFLKLRKKLYQATIVVFNQDYEAIFQMFLNNFLNCQQHIKKDANQFKLHQGLTKKIFGELKLPENEKVFNVNVIDTIVEGTIKKQPFNLSTLSYWAKTNSKKHTFLSRILDLYSIFIPLEKDGKPQKELLNINANNGNQFVNLDQSRLVENYIALLQVWIDNLEDFELSMSKKGKTFFESDQFDVKYQIQTNQEKLYQKIFNPSVQSQIGHIRHLKGFSLQIKYKQISITFERNSSLGILKLTPPRANYFITVKLFLKEVEKSLYQDFLKLDAIIKLVSIIINSIEREACEKK